MWSAGSGERTDAQPANHVGVAVLTAVAVVGLQVRRAVLDYDHRCAHHARQPLARPLFPPGWSGFVRVTRLPLRAVPVAPPREW